MSQRNHSYALQQQQTKKHEIKKKIQNENRHKTKNNDRERALTGTEDASAVVKFSKQNQDPLAAHT